jgi:hypothetical protein
MQAAVPLCCAASFQCAVNCHILSLHFSNTAAVSTSTHNPELACLIVHCSARLHHACVTACSWPPCHPTVPQLKSMVRSREDLFDFSAAALVAGGVTSFALFLAGLAASNGGSTPEVGPEPVQQQQHCGGGGWRVGWDAGEGWGASYRLLSCTAACVEGWGGVERRVLCEQGLVGSLAAQ